MRPQLDTLPTAEVVRLLLDAERRVVPAAEAALPALVTAADLMAARWLAGGRLVFAGAGTSGRIAAAEAAELPGTFGLDRSRVLCRLAGGLDSTDRDEDDLRLADQDVADLAFTVGDVLVAVAASGSTPYTLTLADAARTAGATVIAVVNVAPSPLCQRAEVSVVVSVGPEVVHGSTRLTAGTAQKVALNAMTTAAMVRAGRVHGDLMIDVEPANAKLRDRAAGIVAEIAGCDRTTAEAALESCGGARAAVLHLVLGVDPSQASVIATQHRTLRAALDSQVV